MIMYINNSQNDLKCIIHECIITLTVVYVYAMYMIYKHAISPYKDVIDKKN